MSQSGIAAFFAQIGPFLHGAASHAETAGALYGDPADAVTARHAERLAIYGRFCALHRLEALKVFEATEAAVRQHAAASDGSRPASEAWSRLVERYFVAHPMHHFEINQNGEFFPEFLATTLAAEPEALPPFIAELADFEWWEWLVIIAPDAESDQPADAGPLRLSSTVDLRPYHYDFVGWLDAEPEERSAVPEPGEHIVFFWRDRTLRGRRDRALPIELVVVKAILEGMRIDDGLAAQIGVDFAELSETLADLHAAGIVLGAVSEAG